MRIGNRDLNIEIYCDCADVETIRKMRQDPRVSGFTTNPSLARKAGVKDYFAFCCAAHEAADGYPISFEVLSEEGDEIIDQALRLSGIGRGIFVKVPVVTSSGKSSVDLIRDLSGKGCWVNATAVFTIHQMSQLCLALKSATPAIISVFAGRIADTGVNAEWLLDHCRKSCLSNERTKLLWASPREPYNVIQAAQAGCDIITLFPEFLNKLDLFGKDLNEFARETSAMFARDASEAGFTL